MKTMNSMALVLLLSMTALATVSFASGSSGTVKKVVKSVKTNSQAQLGTSFKFDGSSLRGKYQSSLGANATVENDKYMDDLLGGRKKFDDRIRDEKKRN